jgi:hypothetical protein
MVGEKSAAVAERHALRDAIDICLVHDRSLAETAEALGVFGLGQMAAAGAGAQDFAGGGDFEPLGRGFLRFNTFWTTHKIYFNSKRARTIRIRADGSKQEFFKNRLWPSFQTNSDSTHMGQIFS